MDGAWDEMFEAREAICLAEGHLQAVEGHLHEMDNWVRKMCQ